MSTPPNPPYPLHGPPKPVSVPAGTSAQIPGWTLANVQGPIEIGPTGMPRTEWAVAPYCTCKGSGAGSSYVDRGDGKYVASCCLRPSRVVWADDSDASQFEGRAFGPGPIVEEVGPEVELGVGLSAAPDYSEPPTLSVVPDEPKPARKRRSRCKECGELKPLEGEHVCACQHEMPVDQCAVCTPVDAPEVYAAVDGTPLPAPTWSEAALSEVQDELAAHRATLIGAAETAGFVARAEANAQPRPVSLLEPAMFQPGYAAPEATGPCGCGGPPGANWTTCNNECGSRALSLLQPEAEASSVEPPAVQGKGARMKFSNSELRAWKRCRRKWWLSYYRRLTLRREGVGPLSIGNMVHWPLECYYGTPNRDPETFDWETPLAQHVEARLNDPNLPEHLYNDMLGDYELVKIMLRGYFQWLTEEGSDSELNVLAAEREIEAFIDHIDGQEVWLIGKLDAEAEMKSDGRRVFIDHKSVANLADLPKTGQLDEQQQNYGLLQRLEAKALREAGLPHAEAFATGGVWNMLRKVKRTASAKPPFYGRAGVSHNDEVYRNFYKRVWGEIRDILHTRAQLDAGGDFQVEVYPNPSRDCSWDCPFVSICPMFDDGSDVEAVISMEYVEQDPYARYTEIEKG